MSSPFIVNKTKFVYSSSKKFETYINYIDREEAKRDKAYNQYSLYNDYMENEMKSTGLISIDKESKASCISAINIGLIAFSSNISILSTSWFYYVQ
ncbi:relaxase MobL [Clostridioides mangenotii]|uniref:relaxase MobL n=1 Tax=Metaclostridioides mangenotii TaxID=1540 RepID=UPI002149ECB6|nr:relaxase MobL [Clostridioides mangenotii]MCR1953209.1 relaxase MobL [Clostridioides mangenotii]